MAHNFFYLSLVSSSVLVSGQNHYILMQSFSQIVHMCEIIVVCFHCLHLFVLQDIKATVLRTLAAIVHLDRNPKYVISMRSTFSVCCLHY